MAEADDLKDALPGAAARFDALRAAGLTGMDGAMAVRQAGLQHEHDRLARRLGREHPRVQELAARIEEAAAGRRRLAVEVARAETPLVRPDEHAWAVHGYVRWKDLSPAADVTVSLVDAKGQWLKSLGYACTDARGYFRLPTKVEHAAEESVNILSVFIRVTDEARKELYRGQDALPVLPGVVDYREIVLEGGGRVCAAPEGEDTPGSPRTDAKSAREKKSRRSKPAS